MKFQADLETDVLVIGAGPAGSLAAHQLVRQGLRVLLVDKAKFPRPKVCGSTLHPQGIAVLEACGLGGLLARAVEAGHAVLLREAQIFIAGSRATVDLCGSLAMGRDTFDWALVQAAVEMGVEFRDATLASLADEEFVGDRRCVRLRTPQGDVLVKASLVIAADGLNGLLARGEGERKPTRTQYLGAAWATAEAPAEYVVGRIAMACGREGYVGAVRLGDGRLLLACALDPESTRRAGGVGALAAGLLDEARLPAVAGMREGRWHGTSRFPAASAAIAARRLFAIGDSASFVEPFTGQGISWALLSARAVAPIAAAAAQSWRDNLVSTWMKTHAKVVGRRQRACHVIAWLLRRPQLARHAVAAMSRLPWIATPLVRRITQ